MSFCEFSHSVKLVFMYKKKRNTAPLSMHKIIVLYVQYMLESHTCILTMLYIPCVCVCMYVRFCVYMCVFRCLQHKKFKYQSQYCGARLSLMTYLRNIKKEIHKLMRVFRNFPYHKTKDSSVRNRGYIIDWNIHCMNRVEELKTKSYNLFHFLEA